MFSITLTATNKSLYIMHIFFVFYHIWLHNFKWSNTNIWDNHVSLLMTSKILLKQSPE